jgi:phage protein U
MNNYSPFSDTSRAKAKEWIAHARAGAIHSVDFAGNISETISLPGQAEAQGRKRADF